VDGYKSGIFQDRQNCFELPHFRILLSEILLGVERRNEEASATKQGWEKIIEEQGRKAKERQKIIEEQGRKAYAGRKAGQGRKA